MADITQILRDVESGDPSAAEQLLPLVYDELRKLAAHRIATEQPGQTLQATALVHDAYLRIAGGDDQQHWDNRGHFFAAASKAMHIWGERMIAGDHAPPAGHFSTSYKDAVLIAAQAKELAVPVALRDAVYENFKEGMDDGLADYDNSAVIEVIRRQIGQGRIPRTD